MFKTFTCILNQDVVKFTNFTTSRASSMTYREFDALIPRRRRAKLSITSRLAGGLWQYNDLNKQLESQDADPKNTPLLILNRYANWDYVTEMMCSDIAVTLEAVNNYVATAWFPASLQGYLTIEQGNKAEAITLATNNIHMQAAVIESLFLRNSRSEKIGTVVVGTFECLPRQIGAQNITDSNPFAFGAFSLISSESSKVDIKKILSTHKELYRYVKH